MHDVSLTVDELIDTLKRSQLPTVVTEGKDDYAAFRRVEDALSEFGLSMLPAGGRDAVLEIFDRRKEIGRNNIMFVVDLDAWVFDGIPPQYQHRKVMTTDGYSLENDLFRDGDLEQLLVASERQIFRQELFNVIDWFSFALRELRSGADSCLSHHPSKVLDSAGRLNALFMAQIGFTSRDQELYDLIAPNYSKMLRGKTLIEVLIRRLSASGRIIKFGRKQLLEIACSRQGAYYTKIETGIRNFFIA